MASKADFGGYCEVRQISSIRSKIPLTCYRSYEHTFASSSWLHEFSWLYNRDRHQPQVKVNATVVPGHLIISSTKNPDTWPRNLLPICAKCCYFSNRSPTGQGQWRRRICGCVLASVWFPCETSSLAIYWWRYCGTCKRLTAKARDTKTQVHSPFFTMFFFVSL